MVARQADPALVWSPAATASGFQKLLEEGVGPGFQNSLRLTRQVPDFQKNPSAKELLVAIYRNRSHTLPRSASLIHFPIGLFHIPSMR